MPQHAALCIRVAEGHIAELDLTGLAGLALFKRAVLDRSLGIQHLVDTRRRHLGAG